MATGPEVARALRVAYLALHRQANTCFAMNGVTADPEKTNKAYKLIWLGSGTDAAINGGRALDKVLKDKGIRHEWVESEGYRHDDQIWRIYPRDVLPKLLRD
jgi:hypothetical protein